MALDPLTGTNPFDLDPHGDMGASSSSDPFMDWILGRGAQPSAGTVGGPTVDPNVAAPPDASAIGAAPAPVTQEAPPTALPPPAPPEIEMPPEFVGAQPAPLEPPPDVATPPDPWASQADPWAPPESTGQIDPSITGYINDPFNAPDDETAGRYLADLAMRDPARAAELEGHHQNLERADFAKRSLAHAQQAEDDYKAYTASVQHAQKAIEQIAATPVDRGHMWASKSTGQKFAGYLAAALGGLVQSKTGGINRGLELIQHLQDQDMDEQRALLQRKQGALAALIPQLGDQYRAEQTLRRAQWDETISQLQNGLSQVDPRGSAAIRIKNDIVEATAKRNAALQHAKDVEQKTFQDNYKLAQEDRKLDQGDAELALKQMAAQVKAAGGAGGGGSPLVATSGDTDDSFILGLPKGDRDNAVKIPGGGVALVYNPTIATEANKTLLGHRKVIDHIDAALVLTKKMPDWEDKVKAKVGLTGQDILVLQSELQQVALAGKEAANLGALAGPDLGILEKLGADPENATKLNMTADKLDAILKNWRSGVVRDATNTVKQYGVVAKGTGRPDFGAAPADEKQKTVKEYRSAITAAPDVKKDGSIDQHVTIGQRLAYLEAADHQRTVEKMDDKAWDGQLQAMTLESERNLRQLHEQQTKAEDAIWKKGGLKGTPTPEQRAVMADEKTVAPFASAIADQEKLRQAIHLKRLNPIKRGIDNTTKPIKPRPARPDITTIPQAKD